MSVKLELNKAVRLALTRLDPFYNEQYKTLMFSVRCEDGSDDKMFLPRDQADVMRNIHVGEVFTICKRKTPQDGTYFEVRTATMAPPITEPPSKLESQLEASIHHVQAQQRAQLPSKVTAPVQPQAVCEEAPQHTSNGTELSQLLAGCMVAAIDAAVLARNYAHGKGLTLSFTEGSIQDLTSTLMIHQQKMAELERRYPAASGRDQVNSSVPRAWRQ